MDVPNVGMFLPGMGVGMTPDTWGLIILGGTDLQYVQERTEVHQRVIRQAQQRVIE